MRLQDSGNLVLLDRNNVSLWGSFDHPTDTIVMGQSLAVGTSVDCYTADNDRSDGDYRLVVTAGDAVLQWNRMSYWKLSAEPKGSQDSMVPVSFLALNDTGLFLLGSDRSTVVIKLTLGPANFRVAKFLSFVTKWGYALQEDALVHQISMVILSQKVAARRQMLHLLCLQASSMEIPQLLVIFLKTLWGLSWKPLAPTENGFICWRRNRLYRAAKSKLGRDDSSSSELEIISVPGLPVRFNYEDLVSATESFSTQIGSGGFGTVYRGTLPDKSVVAVKKITNVGVQGKKEFCWEPRQAYFPLHALEMHEKKRYSELADSRLEGRVTNEEVRKLVKVALCCLHEDPILRPTMVTVVSMLEGISPVTEPRQESLNFLRFYGRRFSEASRIEGSNERNEFGFSSSDKLMSCMSAQQLSGPR
ncbi:G-TYPE LECTIN S-RECEPTOR-LIKE SERINE/THREONINE-PROTEIN KINASE SD2-5 [Salix purpurea]|uniref:G-TYPE LECTIN S-RECEPTOR-LIKE SERINE/THREONINE-PROTEIN KINASE SD2-5 n=1 Tax=Salix purpurea TaxID=77065 RepID=A0A9Q0V9Y9_SALPP|nr:G-TYPE LECTIN S-RECEPTOR-LIKE SERINE/THREONINE-PROTEIN KINASE SD2-5 [Salix purpurea]